MKLDFYMLPQTSLVPLTLIPLGDVVTKLHRNRRKWGKGEKSGI